MQTDDDTRGPASSNVDSFLRHVASAPAKEVSASLRRVEDLLGEVLDGKYRVESLLGQGGMGAVYLATHLGTGRAVALKVLIPEFTANEDAVERFRREAQAAGRVRHPNVVDVTDFGFATTGDDRRAYLVMEHLRGQTLRAHLDASGPLAVDAAIEMLRQVCAGVAEAHALGILHRDLKPENIHLEPGERGRYRVKVLDFGIAKLLGSSPAPDAGAVAASGPPPALDEESALTRDGAAMGTPRYMAPEQWTGAPVDVRTDVYSLGVLAYEMLTGEPPFLGKGTPIAIEQQLRPRPLAAKLSAVPRGIARIIESALAVDPAKRPSSVAGFAAVLHAGTETVGRLTRRSITLCLEHYGLFFRPSLVLWIPVLLLSLGSLASALLVRTGLVSSRVDHWLALGLSQVEAFYSFLISVTLIGLLVPLSADLVAAGRPLRPPPPTAEFWRILRGSLPSSLVKIAILGTVPALVILPVVKLAHIDTNALGNRVIAVFFAYELLGYLAITPFILAAPVVGVERLRGLAPLRRSANLVRPVLGTAIGVILLWHFLALAIQTSLSLAAAAITSTPLHDVFARTKEMMALPAFRVSEVINVIVQLIIGPSMYPLEALLYLQAREAEGDPMRGGGR
jgi:hypothetical protein